MAQRTKDLKGLAGQVRGFNLDEFLSDWEEPGTAIPWSPGDQAWVQSSPLTSRQAVAIPSHLSVHAEEMTKRVKVLYVPDYVAGSSRLNASSELWKELSTLLPKREVDLAMSEGPFEDAEGIGAHFDVKTLQQKKEEQRIKALTVDFHSSIIKSGRNASLHKPEILVGHGHGA